MLSCVRVQSDEERVIALGWSEAADSNEAVALLVNSFDVSRPVCMLSFAQGAGGLTCRSNMAVVTTPLAVAVVHIDSLSVLEIPAEYVYDPCFSAADCVLVAQEAGIATVDLNTGQMNTTVVLKDARKISARGNLICAATQGDDVIRVFDTRLGAKPIASICPQPLAL